MKRVLRMSVACASAGLVLTGLSVVQPAAAAPPSALNVIVTLKPGSSPRAAATGLLAAAGGRVTHVYSHALKGFAGSLPTAALSLLSLDPRVASIEIDRGMSISATQSPTPSWGIDRTDQRNLPFNNSYSYNSTGAGVKAYIIDTGISIGHPDFGGRASSGFDAIDGGSADDCHGHGTHVAGTVGGTAYGVAKGVELVAVRVLNCEGSGTNAQVIAGIDWVVGNHAAGAPAVANMSLGGSASTAIDSAVQRMITDGVTVAVAAGNDNANACNSSPARVAGALTTGASDTNDARASFSNIGTCVDLFAPGVNITSDWLNNGTYTISGTSMATPHVAGVAAQYLQTNTAASPATVSNAVLAKTTKDKITGTAGGCVLFIFCTPATPNNDLLFSDF
ncbi:MAG TPA: S8 family serine peptidase [Nocardioidaceae bacterium]|nr:S8 family serine peptidase [Nocardioidaceae bacterium]